MGNKRERISAGEKVTLFKRGKKGIWQMDFHYQGHRTVSTKTTKKKLAMRKALLLEAAFIDGTFAQSTADSTRTQSIGSKRIRIGEAIKQYIDYHKSKGSRPKTLVKYRGILELFEETLLGCGCEWMDQFQIEYFDKFRTTRIASVSKATMHNDTSNIKRFFHWCVGRGLIISNRLESVSSVKPRRRTKEVLVLQQIRDVVAQATKLRKYVFAMLAFTGMRISEARNLRVEDVDFRNNWIHIVSRQGYENKTDQDWKLPLHRELKTILLEKDWPKTGWFFTALPSSKYPDGNHHINPRRINEDFKTVLAGLDIPAGKKQNGFTVHSLRHFFKTHCITNGKFRKPLLICGRDTN